jgi:hypothetical protein
VTLPAPRGRGPGFSPWDRKLPEILSLSEQIGA